MPKIDTSIFKAYDLRGVYPDQIDADVAYKVGRAYVTLIRQEQPDKELKIVVGADMRTSTPELKAALIKGLTESGVNVIDIGLSSTPTFYFAVAHYGYDGGVMVSASHNPAEYNGFKMTRAGAVPISGDTGIEDIKQMVVNEAFVQSKTTGKTEIKEGVLDDEYESQVKEMGLSPEKIKPFKIVVDAANAMGALDVEKMFAQTNCELIKINFELDGSFPSHEADPLKEENMELTKKAVIEHKADLGISPDGDGDRYFFIDDTGKSMRQEILRGIMAQMALKDNPGATVCYDIRPGKITKDMIEEVGGKASVTKVGHSLIKEQMIKEGAIFGGESSGHYFYKFKSGSYEAPIVLVLKFLEFLSEQNKPLSQVIKPLQVYFHSGEINSTVSDPQAVMTQLETTYSDAEISKLDGITITYPEYWFNVRASNTEPKLRLNLEAVSKEKMEEKRDEVLAVIRK